MSLKRWRSHADGASRVSAPTKIRFDHRIVKHGSLLGSTGRCPAISWVVDSAPVGWTQDSVEMRLSDVGRCLTVTRVVECSRSTFVDWPFAPLEYGAKYRFSLRVHGAEGKDSPWSEEVAIELGPLEIDEWTGRPVSPADNVGRDAFAPVLFKRLEIPDGAYDARISLTAAGIYELFIDGKKVGTSELAPGWTDYRMRFVASTIDISEYLAPGEHEICVLLGNGWYRGRLTWETDRANVYGDKLWAMADVSYRDATNKRVVVGTDTSWKWRPSNIEQNDLYDGERIDLRRPHLGDWAVARDTEVLDLPCGKIVPEVLPLPSVVQRLRPKGVISTASGKKVLDFGQNLVGRLKIQVTEAEDGDEITIRHAEVLENGEICVRPLRNAQATDSVMTPRICPEDEVAVAFTLTLHGFRYAEVTGFRGDDDVLIDSIVAEVVSAEQERIGYFHCSNPLLDRFFENAYWSALGNFVSVPTDCPQRDERLGWTGDIGVFADSALLLMDSSAFLTSWMDDVASSQGENGGIPVVVPDILDGPKLTCAWGDACVLVPWAIYQATGDIRILKRYLLVMSAFVDGVARVATDYLWRGGFQYGDWLDPDAPPDDAADAKADPDVVATAYFGHSAQLVSESWKRVGNEGQAKYYEKLARKVRKAYRNAYVTPDGRIISDCATVYSQALCWNLLKKGKQRDGAAERLADIARERCFRISTGFVGTPLILPALEKAEFKETALRLAMEKKCPSWLYPVSMGATTIWERWDSMLPDGSINLGEMTSFNHYALGAMSAWLIEGVAGLKKISPGFERISVAPLISEYLETVSVCLDSPFGSIEIKWRIDKESREVTGVVVIPVGVEARVSLPGQEDVEVSHGTYEWCAKLYSSAPIRVLRDLVDCKETWEGIVGLVQDKNRMSSLSEAEEFCMKKIRPYFDSPVECFSNEMIHELFCLNGSCFHNEISNALGDYLRRNKISNAEK